MKVAVPRETAPGERRVALVPSGIAKFESVTVEAGAGAAALHPDAEYQAAGAAIAADFDAAVAGTDVTVKVQAPSLEEAQRLPEGSGIVSLFQPGSNLELVRLLQ